jgi:hypothetical protein
MSEEEPGAWVYRMAELLVCEIMDQMAGIQVSRCSGGETPAQEMDTVGGYVAGGYQMEVFLRAEPALFRRIACNLIGGEPDSPEEIQDYAMELFNVLCGRFVSEVSRTTHVPAYFEPPMYFKDARDGGASPGEPMSTLFFESDQKERAEFSWTSNSMNQLLRRSGTQ